MHGGYQRNPFYHLGMDKLAFIKTEGGFKARKITTGISHQNHIQVISGIAETDSVAANAQYPDGQ